MIKYQNFLIDPKLRVEHREYQLIGVYQFSGLLYHCTVQTGKFKKFIDWVVRSVIDVAPHPHTLSSPHPQVLSSWL